MKNSRETLEENGFKITEAGNGLFNVTSVETGGVILKAVPYTEIVTLADGIEYSLTQNVEDAWKRPIRETGYYEVRECL